MQVCIPFSLNHEMLSEYLVVFRVCGYNLGARAGSSVG